MFTDTTRLENTCQAKCCARQLPRQFGGVLPGLPGSFAACGTRCVFTAYGTKLQAGTTIDEVIVYLHDQGLSILDTIKVIRQVGRMSLGDAKQTVSNHTVWQQTVKANEALHWCAGASSKAYASCEPVVSHPSMKRQKGEKTHEVSNFLRFVYQ